MSLGAGLVPSLPFICAPFVRTPPSSRRRGAGTNILGWLAGSIRTQLAIENATSVTPEVDDGLLPLLSLRRRERVSRSRPRAPFGSSPLPLNVIRDFDILPR